MDESVFELQEDFDSAVASSRWSFGWIIPWRAARLRARLRALCANPGVSSEAELARLAIKMMQRLPPPTLRGRSAYVARCPLAAALEAGNMELAEELWMRAPRKWWRDGEALLGEARRPARSEEWIDRLLECWRASSWSGRGPREKADWLTADVLGHCAIKDRTGNPQWAAKRWRSVLAKVGESPALSSSLAIMCATRGGENEDWGLMAIKNAKERSGDVFIASLCASNSPVRRPASTPWSEEGIRALARGCSRRQLLMALALCEPDAAHNSAAKHELGRRGLLGLDNNAAGAAHDVIEHYAILMVSCRSNGIDESCARTWRREALVKFSQRDLLREGKRMARRRLWTTRGWRGAADERLAESIAAVAEQLPSQDGLSLRTASGMEGSEFDRHFECLDARSCAMELDALCANARARGNGSGRARRL